MARRATLRAVLALALVAGLVSAQDASCAMQGSCDAGLSSPDADSTVEPAIEHSTVEATPETAKALDPEARSPRLDVSPEETPSDESATPPPVADVVDAGEDPVEVEDHAAIASALRLELERARAEIERLERVAADQRQTGGTAELGSFLSAVESGTPGSGSACADLEDAWFPPWAPRRAGQALAAADGARRAATALGRAILDGFGVLERVDAFVAEIDAYAAPHVAFVSRRCEAFAGRARVARENFAKLAREVRKSSARRRERALAERAAERQRRLDAGEPVEPETPRFSEAYWKRQGQRANALFGDLQVAIGSAYGAVSERVAAKTRDAAESLASARQNFETRVRPAWSRARLAVRQRLAVPVASALLERFPGPTEKTLGLGARALRFAGFAGYANDLANLDESAKALGAALGDAFVVLVVSCGVAPTMYFAVFRARQGDALPDEATVAIKHVPANDGTFLGSHAGGGVDVVVTLPEVKRARECDILVGEDEVKVRALEGYHDVTVAIPPEAKGSEWRRGSDAWVMRAKFDLKTEALTVSLRTPAAATARGAASPLGDEKENAKRGKGGAAVFTSDADAPAPFSPVTPNRSVAADKAAAAVKAAASTRKKKASGGRVNAEE